MANLSATKRILFKSPVLDTVVEIKGWESGDSGEVIISTIDITNYAGAAKAATCFFKLGHRYTNAELVQFGKDKGYDVYWYGHEEDGESNETYYEAKQVTFTVEDGDENALEDAEVIFNGETKSSAADGTAVFTNVAEADGHPYSVTLATYDDETGTVDVDGDEAVTVTMTLT